MAARRATPAASIRRITLSPAPASGRVRRVRAWALGDAFEEAPCSTSAVISLASKGYLNMGQTALSIGANTFQYFSRNPRGGNAKAFDADDAAALVALAGEHGFAPVLTHAPYTLNPCAASEATLDFAHRALSEDLARLEAFPGALYNLHPGCHVGQGVEVGIKKIAESLDAAMFPGMGTTVLLETMAGKGSEVGGRFEELREIIDRVRLSDRVGVCLATPATSTTRATTSPAISTAC